MYCFDKCMVYLVSVDQRNLLKRKGMSYIVKQHMLYRGCKGSNPCNTNVTGGTGVIVAE